jgi:hypothetical protein
MMLLILGVMVIILTLIRLSMLHLSIGDILWITISSISVSISVSASASPSVFLSVVVVVVGHMHTWSDTSLFRRLLNGQVLRLTDRDNTLLVDEGRSKEH